MTKCFFFSIVNPLAPGFPCVVGPAGGWAVAMGSFVICCHQNELIKKFGPKIKGWFVIPLLS